MKTSKEILEKASELSKAADILMDISIKEESVTALNSSSTIKGMSEIIENQAHLMEKLENIESKLNWIKPGKIPVMEPKEPPLTVFGFSENSIFELNNLLNSGKKVTAIHWIDNKFNMLKYIYKDMKTDKLFTDSGTEIEIKIDPGIKEDVKWCIA